MAEIKLTAEQSRIILEKVQEKIINYSCSLCGNKNASVESYIVNLPIANDFSVRLGGQISPMVPLVCTNCGHTSFLNIMTLGLGQLFKK
jgi:RNase P subunit RPR2